MVALAGLLKLGTPSGSLLIEFGGARGRHSGRHFSGRQGGVDVASPRRSCGVVR
jgi:hypothetical protein